MWDVSNRQLMFFEIQKSDFSFHIIVMLTGVVITVKRIFFSLKIFFLNPLRVQEVIIFNKTIFLELKLTVEIPI